MNLRALSLLAAAAVLLADGAFANHRVRLIGAGDQRSLGSHRVISKITRPAGAQFVDRTADGTRVGQLVPSADNLGRAERGNALNAFPEDRIMVIRPVLAELPNAQRGWRVVSVTQQTFVANTQTFEVLDNWGEETGPQQIFEIRKADAVVTQQRLVALFQAVLDAGNNSSATNGLYLVGTQNLKVTSTQPLLFDVLVELPLSVGTTPDSTAVHPLIPVTAAAEIRDIVIGIDRNGFNVTQRLNVLAFQAGASGTGTVYVIDPGNFLRPVIRNLGVAPGIVYRTVVRNEFLRSGANQLVLEVADNTDLDVPVQQRARGFSDQVTMNNPP